VSASSAWRPIVVLNDEAHHTHDEESEWNTSFGASEGRLRGLSAQLDFSPHRGIPRRAVFLDGLRLSAEEAIIDRW